MESNSRVRALEMNGNEKEMVLDATRKCGNCEWSVRRSELSIFS